MTDVLKLNLKPNAMSWSDVMDLCDKIPQDIKDRLVLAVDKDDPWVEDALEHLGRRDEPEPITHLFGFKVRLVETTTWRRE